MLPVISLNFLAKIATWKCDMKFIHEVHARRKNRVFKCSHWWRMEIASDVVKAIFHTWKLDMNFIWSSDWLQWTIYEVLCPSQEVEPLCVKTTCEVLHELREPPRTPISMYHHLWDLWPCWLEVLVFPSITPKQQDYCYYIWHVTVVI